MKKIYCIVLFVIIGWSGVFAQQGCSAGILPVSGATGVSVKPIFTWAQSLYNIMFYELNIIDVSNNTTVLNYPVSGGTYNTTYNLEFSYLTLSPNKTYDWYIRPYLAFGALGNNSSPTFASGCEVNKKRFTTGSLTCINNISPSNGSISQRITPTLSWNSSAGANQYDVYLGTSATTTALLTTVNTNSYDIPISSNLLTNTTYYWYVVPKNSNTGLATGCNTTITSFTTGDFSCTANILPTNLAINQSVTPTLSWNANAVATSYDVYFGTTSIPTTLLINVIQPTYSIPTGASLLNNTTYYWYVVPKNGTVAAIGCESSVTSFTTFPLNCVTGITPTNGQTLLSSQINLTWNVTGTTSYDVFVDTTNPPTTLAANVSTNSYAFSNYTQNSTYYWYVVPKNGNLSATGCVSNVRNFNTGTCVQNSLPPSGSFSLSQNSVRLEWFPLSGASNYDVFVNNVLLTNVATSFYNLATGGNSSYSWYVVPKNSTGVAVGCPSSLFGFSTVNTLSNSYGCNGFYNPLNGQTNVSLNTFLSWGNLALGGNFPQAYRLFMGTSPSNLTLLATLPVGTTSYPLTNLLPNTTYYWVIYNTTLGGGGSCGAPSSFTTVPLSCVANISPANNSTGITLSPLLTWQPSTIPFGTYNLYLGTTNPPTFLTMVTINSFNFFPTPSSLLPNTTYYWYVVPRIGITNATGCSSNITSFTTIASYCIPPYSYPCNSSINIADFKLKGEGSSNISVIGTNCSAGSYTDLSASSNANLAIGKSYVGSLRPTTYNLPQYTLVISIWIDFNDNGGFEVDENVLYNYSPNYTLLSTGLGSPFSIYIPSTAALGVHKMRVRQVLGPIGSAPIQVCGLYNYGETKDFTVTIVGSGAAPIVSSQTNCNTLAATTINAGTNNSNVFVPILDTSGNIVAMINANGNNLDQIESSIYRNTGAVRQVGSGPYYLDRNITITPAAQPSSVNVGVRIYYTAAELAAFQTVVPTANASSLNISKTNQGCASAFAGTEVLLSQTGSGTYGSNYYMELSTPGFSSFYIKNGFGALPIFISYIKGIKYQNTNLIEWKLNCDAGSSITVTLERSGDGIVFNDLQTQSVTDVMCANSFTYKDAKALAGANYYRLKIVTANGEIKYSSIVVLLNKDSGFELISIAPNPVKNKAALTISSAKAGRINITMSDVAGKTILNQANSIIAGSNNIDMNLETLATGTYFITAINTDGEIKTTKFVKY
jgi:hypothetical protein